MTDVRTPDGQTIQFPDNMSEEQIKVVLRRHTQQLTPRGSMAETAGQPTAVGRVIQAGIEGAAAPFQTPIKGPSPEVQSFINQSGPFRGVNQTLLAGAPAAAQAVLKVLGSVGGAVTGAAGQAIAEVRGQPETGGLAAEQLRPLAAAAVGPEIGVASTIRTPMRIPQIVGASKKLEQGAVEAAQVLGEQGVTLPAAKATTSMALDMMANTAETSVLSGRLRNANAKAESAAQAAVDGFAADLTSNMTKENVGEVIQGVVENKVDAFNAAARGAYKAVDDAMAKDGSAGPMVDLRPLKELAAKIQGEVQAGADPAGGQLLNNLLDKQDFVSFGDAQILRSDLLNLGYNLKENIPGRNKVFGQRLAPLVDQEMERAAAAAGPNALEAWRSANDFSKQGKDTFNSRIMKAIAKNDPDTVYQSLVKNNRPNNIRRVRDVVGPETWKKVQGQFVQDMYSGALDGTNLSGDKLMAAIKKFEQGGIYKEVLNDPAVADRWKVLARTLQITQKGNQTSALKIRGTLTAGFVPEIYAAVQLARGSGTYANGAILLGPTILNRILSSPRLTKWMLQGIGNPSGSIVGTNAVRNFTTALVANGIVDKAQDPTANLNKLNAAQAAANLQHNTTMKLSTSGPIVPIGP